MKRVIVDTGPFVAWFCPRDQHHAWAREAFTKLGPGSLTCEAVLVETCHLVAKDEVPRAKVIEFIERGRVVVMPRGAELSAIGKLLDRYSDTPMDFADAGIVRLAEIHNEMEVCTVDED